MMTRDFMIQHHGGVAAVPHYTAWCVDDEAQHRAQAVKQWIKADDAVISHNKINDATWQLNERRIETSRAIFHKRKAQIWPNDYEPIIRW